MKTKQQIIKPIEPVSNNDPDNIILEVINDLIYEMANEADINFIMAAAEHFTNEINITYDINQISEVIDSYNYLYWSDGAYYMLDCYDTPLFNTFLDIDYLRFYDPADLDINFITIDQKTAAAYLEAIDIDNGQDITEFLSALEYQEDIFLPDIVYNNREFYNTIKNNQLEITTEIKTLLEQQNENNNYGFISETTETIETEYIEILTEYIDKKLIQHINTAASHSNYWNYIVLNLYHYQEY